MVDFYSRKFPYKNRVQILNPKTNRWIKIDIKRGLILAHKKSPSPYKYIKILE